MIFGGCHTPLIRQLLKFFRPPSGAQIRRKPQNALDTFLSYRAGVIFWVRRADAESGRAFLEEEKGIP
jgi:hypothetical protein